MNRCILTNVSIHSFIHSCFWKNESLKLKRVLMKPSIHQIVTGLYIIIKQGYDSIQTG